MFSMLNIDCVTVNNSEATTPILIKIFPKYMQNAITRWCCCGPFMITGGSSDLIHVSVIARIDKSLSVIRLWGNGALLTTDLIQHTESEVG